MKIENERLSRLRVLADMVRENELAQFAALKTRIKKIPKVITKRLAPNKRIGRGDKMDAAAAAAGGKAAGSAALAAAKGDRSRFQWRQQHRNTEE